MAIIIFIALLSPWTWSIFSQNWLIGIFCIILGFLLLLNFNYNRKLGQGIKISILCLWAVILVYSLVTSFDKNLFNISETQYINVLKRQEIYAREFNHLYTNRLGIYYFNTIKPFIYRYTNNISSLFDLENLFISSYDEDKHKTRFPILFLPPMILGLFYLLKSFNKKFTYIMTIILITAGFLDSKNILGPIIVYSIICASIGLGFSRFLNIKR